MNFISTRLQVIQILAATCLLAGIPSALAQEPPGPPEVIGVASDYPGNPLLAGLGNHVTVTVTNLASLVADATQGHREIVLYINGLALKGLYPESTDMLRGQLRFELNRTEGAREVWAGLLGRPDHAVRKITVSVGLEDQYPVASKIAPRDSLSLIVIRKWWLAGSLATLGILLLWFWISGRNSQLLRDGGPDPGAGNLRPYSLAKVQMAFWFFLILAAFLFIWAITGAHDTITNSVLVLMGIGSGTALGVAVQDKGKEGTSQVLTQIQTLTQTKAALLAQNVSVAEIEKKILELAPASDRFLADILTDSNGLSLHRFQLFVWTLVLGAIFLIEVYANLAMPDFNTTLLALMGISSGTYLGFMMPEAHSTDQST